VTTFTRVLAYGLVVVLVGAVGVLALAGVTAALALLVTAVGIFVMIALGSLMGGRRGRDDGPAVPDGEERGGTMER
jgi:hypothetical protein